MNHHHRPRKRAFCVIAQLIIRPHEGSDGLPIPRNASAACWLTPAAIRPRNIGEMTPSRWGMTSTRMILRAGLADGAQGGGEIAAL